MTGEGEQPSPRPSPAPPEEASWRVLSVPVEAPPPGSFAPSAAPIPSAAQAPSWVEAIPEPGPPPAPFVPAPGPPGGRVFSLDGRPAPALYLVAWLFSVGGIVALFVTSQAAPSFARSILIMGAILAVGLGFAAGAGYQVVARRDRDPRWYRGPAPVLAFGIVLAISTLVSGLLGGTGAVDPERPVGFLLGLLMVAGAYAVVVWLFVLRTGALSWADMGWPTAGVGRVRRSLRAIGVGSLVLVPTTVGALVLGGLGATILGVEAPSVVPTAATSFEALAVALAAAIVAPIGEELFFRGYALSAWARDLPERTALVRSALFFALVHIANINAASFREGASQALLQLLVIGPIGLVLGWLLLRFGIMAAIAGHVTYNALLLVLLFAARSATTA